MHRLSFSHNNICPQVKRLKLESRYVDCLKETTKFNRKMVSYQGVKGTIIHGWIKYREGFSAQLVEGLIREFGIEKYRRILDPL